MYREAFCPGRDARYTVVTVVQVLVAFASVPMIHPSYGPIHTLLVTLLSGLLG
jgi:hypothetical protein